MPRPLEDRLRDCPRDEQPARPSSAHDHPQPLGDVDDTGRVEKWASDDDGVAVHVGTDGKEA
jgi:hypothetical protein